MTDADADLDPDPDLDVDPDLDFVRFDLDAFSLCIYAHRERPAEIPLPRHVKGILFTDYVRMIRGNKAVDWAAHLKPQDLAFLKARAEPDAWYPMETFERMGNAILRELAGADVEAARLWGRISVDALVAQQPTLLCERQPLETLVRFKVLRSTFFDFDALQIATLIDDHAEILIAYQMGKTAEEAASYQTMGFFERLLELASATHVFARFKERSWAGDWRTVLELRWRTG